MSKKISEYNPIVAGDISSGDVIPLVDISEIVDANKNKKVTIAELTNAFTALGTTEIPASKNEVNNPYFDGMTGWAFGNGGDGTIADGIITFTVAGDLRQYLRQFNANDHRILITADYYSPTIGQTGRLLVVGDDTVYISQPTTPGEWSTVIYEISVTEEMRDKVIILILSGTEIGTKIKNVKVIYNGDVDVLSGSAKLYTNSEIERTKYYVAGFEGKNLIGIGDSFLHSGGILSRIAENTGMIWLQAFQQNPDVEIGTSSGGVPIQPYVDAGSGLPSGHSAYMRADNLAQHAPDVIWLHAGTVTFELEQPEEGYNIWTPAYTGGEQTDIAELDYIACLKGTLKKITEQNPEAKVILTSTIFHSATLEELPEAQWKSFIRKRDAHKAIAEMYSVTFIDVMGGSGVHLYNKEFFAPDGHTTPAGAERIGDFMTRRL